jgi:hypothetical protein
MSLLKIVTESVQLFEAEAWATDPVDGSKIPNSIFQSVGATVDLGCQSKTNLISLLWEVMEKDIPTGDHEISKLDVADAIRSLLVSAITEHVCYQYPNLLAIDDNRSTQLV